MTRSKTQPQHPWTAAGLYWQLHHVGPELPDLLLEVLYAAKSEDPAEAQAARGTLAAIASLLMQRQRVTQDAGMFATIRGE
jgi:hypothetical protein